MNFKDALELISNTNKKITRKNWGYKLSFDKSGFLILEDGRMQLSPYAIYSYDFNYDWIVED